MHQPCLVGLEGFELLGLCGAKVVEDSEVGADALLFGGLWEKDQKGRKSDPRNLGLRGAADNRLHPMILEVLEDEVLPQLLRPRVPCDP